uniref:Caspase-10-like n=1 Tax=Pogona vitticeps TaxID=103695 RepID=A0A6J0V3B6_9SAUR
MEEEDSLKFRSQLLEVDANLGKDDVDALKFLCSDLIAFKRLETVMSAQDIFELLISKDLVNKEDMFLIAELLYLIKHNSLLHILGFTKEDVQNKLPQRRMVSEYREMLYDISEQFTEENVRIATFLLREHLPKKLSPASALELLTSLEKQDLLGTNNLEMLERLCEKISPDLLKNVNRYKERAGSYHGEFQNLNVQEHIMHSLPANQDVKAGNMFDTSEPSLQQPPGNHECKLEKSALYKMDGPHRGCCLIFNNMNFEGSLQDKRRNGSEIDAMELERVFTWLGLEVTTYKDQTAKGMEELLKQWQSSDCLKDRDCLVCCILSHGESGLIFGTDEQKISIRAIMSYFTANRCPFLAKKPKLFFIQACQGEKIQAPFFLDTDNNSPATLGADAQASGFVPTMSIPAEADFLLGMATVDGYLSFRHIYQGSWYIQSLCKKLRDLVPRGEDILSILTAVNADVSQRAAAQGQKKQMPQPAYTLRKKLIFPVP